MISEEVLSYVRTTLEGGASKSQVEQELAKAGWTPEQMAEIFSKVMPATPAPISSPEPTVQSVQQTPSIAKPNMEQPTTANTTPTSAPKKKSSMGIILTVIVLILVLAGAGAYVVFILPNSASTETNTAQTPTTTTGQQDLVDQRNAFDAALTTPVLSDGTRLGSTLNQFSAVVPNGWGVVGTTSEGYTHFDIVNASEGAQGGVIRISRYQEIYPSSVTLKEIAEKEREDLKARSEGFTETSFTADTVAGRETYVLKAESIVNEAKIAITAYLFLDMGRYYIVTGIEADGTTSADFTDAFRTIIDSFQIAAI